MWRVDFTIDDAGTSLVEEVELAPAFLVSRFGPPMRGDGYRVTGRYLFSDGVGGLFTVYDYKSTSSYFGDDEGALEPEEFWESDDDQEFSVGGHGDYLDGSAMSFVAWLLDEQTKWISNRN